MTNPTGPTAKEYLVGMIAEAPEDASMEQLVHQLLARIASGEAEPQPGPVRDGGAASVLRVGGTGSSAAVRFDGLWMGGVAGMQHGRVIDEATPYEIPVTTTNFCAVLRSREHGVPIEVRLVGAHGTKVKVRRALAVVLKIGDEYSATGFDD